MGEWIKIDDRMPEIDEQVWVSMRCPWGERGQAYAIYLGNWQWFMDVTESGDFLSRAEAIKQGLTVCEITHWQPLPEPPHD